MIDVYLGLGSNLGDRARHLREAVRALEREGVRVRVVSPYYETEPWGMTDQPRFLNAACLGRTALGPAELLASLKRIEREMGRVETVRYGPRPIDIDILLYGDVVLCTEDLVIPHPGMLERATVLVPLADIAPDVRHPVTGRTIAEHLRELAAVEGVAPYPPGLAGSGGGP